MVSAGHYACPICVVKMITMTDIWNIYDKEISETPMSEEWSTMIFFQIFKSSLTSFHILGRVFVLNQDIIDSELRSKYCH